MAKITYENKEVGPAGSIIEKHNVTSGNMNEIKKAINDNADVLEQKADLIGGKVSKTQLNDAWFANLTGTGTQEDPYVFAGSNNGGQASPEQWLQSLPGYVVGENRCFYLKTDGSFEWGPIPTGNAEKLGGLVIVAGASSVNSVPLNWNGVADATAYVIQRAENAEFLNATQVYAGAARNFSENNLLGNKDYWYRGRATASGFSPSDWFVIQVKTSAIGDVTPPAPTNPIVNDATNTLDFTFVSGIGTLSEYEFTKDAGANYSAVTEKPIQVGNIQAAAGFVGVRLKAIAGTRTASATLYNTSPFSKVLETPLAPTNPIVDDVNDTFSWTNVQGYPNATDYEISLNGLAATPVFEPVLAKPFYVGNANLAVNQIIVRVKAIATVNNASPGLKNPVPFTIPMAPTIPVTTWTDVLGLEFTGGNSALATPTGGSSFDYGWCSSTVSLPVGGSGFVMAELSDPDGATKNGIVFGLGTSLGRESDTGMNFRIAPIDNNRIIGGVKGQYPISPSLPISVNTLVRMRADGTNVYTEYSTNAGVSWTVNNTAPQPQSVMYIKLFTERLGAKIKNITQSGFQIG